MSFHRLADRESVCTGLAASIALFVSSAALHAQSSVKPLPQAARPAQLAWSLARAVTERESAHPFSTYEAAAAHDTARAHGPQDQGVLFTNVASQSNEASAAPKSGGGPRVELGLQAEFRPQASFNEGPGQMEVARGGWNATLGWKTSDAQGFTLGLHSEASFYRFAGATALVPGSGDGSPFNDMYETSVGSTLCTRTSESTAWFSSAALSVSGEDNASLGDAVTLAAVSGVRYQAAPELTLDCGLAAMTLHEDGPWVLPYLGFEWRIDPDWRLALEGSEVALSVDLDPSWTLSAQAAYRMHQYRLNDDGPAAGGALRDQEIDLGGACEWHPREGTRLRLEAGFVAWREVEVFDGDGAKLSEIEVDPVPYVGLTLQIGF